VQGRTSIHSLWLPAIVFGVGCERIRYAEPPTDYLCYTAKIEKIWFW